MINTIKNALSLSRRREREYVLQLQLEGRWAEPNKDFGRHLFSTFCIFTGIVPTNTTIKVTTEQINNGSRFYTIDIKYRTASPVPSRKHLGILESFLSTVRCHKITLSELRRIYD